MQSFSKWPMRLKTTVSVALILILALGTLSVLAYENSLRVINENIDMMLADKAVDGGRLVLAAVNVKKSAIETIAAREDIRSMKWEIQEGVLSAETQRLGLLGMGVIDGSGVSHSISGSLPLSAASEYYHQALQGETIISDPLIRADDKRAEIVIGTPIKNSGGAIQGVLFAIYDAAFLSELMPTIKVGNIDKAYGSLINKEGVSVAHANYDLVLTQDNNFNNVKKDPELQQLIDLERKMVAGESGMGSYSYKGVSKFLAYAPVEGTNWFLALAAPQKELYKGITALRYKALLITLIYIIIGVAISMFLSLSLTRPILSATNLLGESANQVASAAQQILSSSQQLSAGSAEQASSIEETSSTLQESASMLEQNNANTKQAAQLSGSTKEAAEKGNQQMQEMMEAIGDIKKSSDQIGKIIKVIDDIAFQTNILALNAAVEAARAGEAGMGFAVVAEEVRNLAQRSAQAAKDTTAMIEKNIEISGNGVAVAEKVRDSLNEITVQAKKMSELMEEIAAASQEQSQGIEQVNKAIAQMEAVTQQNASTAEESASASEELSAQAQNLREIVKQLSELVNGEAAKELEKEMRYETKYISHADHQQIGIAPENTRNQKTLPGEPGDDRQQSLTAKGQKTKVISPEDVIPLEKDNRF